jgi:biotin operon repressor
VEVKSMNEQESARQQAKTREQRFVRVLEQEFRYAPRVAQALLEEAQACLLGAPGPLRPGQMRVVLTRSAARHGQTLGDTPQVEVTWSIDVGAADQEVLLQHGSQALRQVRIVRLLDEALAQGGAASQEDLAQALHVSVRTIKRDCAALQARGVYVPTRGNLLGVGRGQTHKAQIVGLWLHGATYDQIARQTRHSLSAIQRYVQTFARVIDLHQQGFAASQVARLLQIGRPLVRDYLAVYQQHTAPECRERLQAQLARLSHSRGGQKGGQ